MGLLDRAFEMLNDNHLPMMESRTRLLQATLSLLANNGQTGGLHGLVERFQEVGLGHLIHSWIGTGPNLPIDAEQMEAVLGEGHLQQIAEETRLSQNEAAEQLGDMLPDLVDSLTPSGHIPQEGLGNMSSLLDHFIGRY